MKFQNQIIVIGMHRSGTSMLVDILEKLGVFMGADQEANKESLFFNLSNVWIMNQSYASWDNPENILYLSKFAKKTITEIILHRIKSAKRKAYFGDSLQERKDFFRIRSIWGWKDPRNTFTIDIWKEIFPEHQIIHLYRNPVDVVNSLVYRERSRIGKRKKMFGTGLQQKYFGCKLPKRKLFYPSFKIRSFEGVFDIWKQYVRKAFSLKKDDPNGIIHLRFEDIIDSPQKSAADLAGFLEIELKDESMISINKLINKKRKDAFLNDPELVKFFNQIKNDELVRELNYGNLSQNK